MEPLNVINEAAQATPVTTQQVVQTSKTLGVTNPGVWTVIVLIIAVAIIGVIIFIVDNLRQESQRKNASSDVIPSVTNKTEITNNFNKDVYFISSSDGNYDNIKRLFNGNSEQQNRLSNSRQPIHQIGDGGYDDEPIEQDYYYDDDQPVNKGYYYNNNQPVVSKKSKYPVRKNKWINI